MRITFHGAAGEVTGSQHLLETDRLKLLLDCGLFQGRRAATRSKNERFAFDPSTLDGVILSHAHIDHCGNLPGLYRAGYRGPVFLTPATADVAEIMLADSARIQAEDAGYLRRKHDPGDPLIEPLYTPADAAAIVGHFEPLEYGSWHELSNALRVRFRDAGHILGSAITELEIQDGNELKRVVFSGDLGRRGLPILRDPEPVAGCDVLITESTYGNRVHRPVGDLSEDLRRIVHEAAVVEGKVIIPAFSLGRTQHVLYLLNDLFNSGRLDRLPVFVDSPLARRLTSVFRDHLEIMDDEVQELLRTDRDPFGFPGMEFVGSHRDSMALNRRRGPFVVIAASGMCENGRVVHHLKHAVGDIRNTIAIIGYQAAHTLGRRIVERQPRLRIFDREYDLRANVEVLNGLSGHADVEDFKWWFESMAEQQGIGRAFLVHGEPDEARALAGVLRDYCDTEPVIPGHGESFEI